MSDWDKGFSIIADLDGNEEQYMNVEMENEMPVLPLRNMVLFPGTVMPVAVGRLSSLELVNKAEKSGKFITVVCQKRSEVEQPHLEDLYKVGTVAKIIKLLEMPDNTKTAIVQGVRRVKLNKITREYPYLFGEVTAMDEVMPEKNDTEFKVLVDLVLEAAINYVRISNIMPPDSTFALKNIKNPMFAINFTCVNIPFMKEVKMELLKKKSLKERAYRLLDLMKKETKLIEIKESIKSRAREDIDQQQREYFLQQQIKTIQDELGGNVQQQEADDFRALAEKMAWSKEVKELFLKEVGKLERTNIQSPDYNVQLNYLQTMTSLPWGKYTTDNLNLNNAEKTLNKDHYGLEKVKERILEHLAVLKLKGDMKSPIICLYGPPGVGKTSLGRSIASALKRKYIRMSLGGVHDEAEIRGHRRTYIGAMPGRIIKGLMKAGTSNPVFILDEIDKVNRDAAHGDPSFALLEVLDPEQNHAFHDNFVDLDYDLSKVMFIATANSLNTIPQPLLDRMELIDVSGYLAEEKVEIAWRHLLPKQLENHGLQAEQIEISKADLRYLIEAYTRESGVRELDKKMAQLCRRSAHLIAAKKAEKVLIDKEKIQAFLGVPRYKKDLYEGNDNIGVVTGLAWTAVGGEILYIESSINKSKNGGKLSLTGNLGDVMKESAILALEYLKAHHESLGLGLDSSVFEDYNVHIHVPEGAVPKDGPSAGITLLCSLASSFTQRKLRKNIAMTGEITLRGRVMPVGGIKEKILAAKRAGIKEIILSEDNRKDIEEIQAVYIKGLTFHFVRNANEVIELALL